MIDLGSMNEVLPYVATLAGAGVGAAFEANAQHTIAKNQQALAAEWGDVHEQQPSNRIRKLAAVALGPLVALGSVVGLANSLAYQSEPAIRQVPPALEITIDHSGATELGINPAAGEISKLSQEFANANQVNATAFVAGSGEVKTMKPSKVTADQPFGDAPLVQATESALDAAKLNRAKATTSGTHQSAAVLAITNGNSLGDSTAIIAQAQAESVPVYTVNVEAKPTDQSTTQDLQHIAAATKGEYWDINAGNINQVGPKIKAALAPEQVKDKQSSSNRLPIRIFTSVVSAGALAIGYRKRRLSTLGNEVYRRK